MTTTQTRPWNAADFLETEEDVVAYIEAVFDDGDPELIVAALGDIAKAEGMTRIAMKAGLGREGLCKALAPDGTPGFATVLKIMRAMDLRFHVSVTQHANSLDEVEPSGAVALVPDS